MGDLLMVPPSSLGARGVDRYGSGAFGAPREKATAGAARECACCGTQPDHPPDYHYAHRGQDRVVLAGATFPMPFDGRIIEPYGWAYGPEWPTLRSIHLLPDRFPGYELKILYGTLLHVGVGGALERGAVLGVCSDVSGKYPGITVHLHYELRRDGELVDPGPHFAEAA